MKKNDMAYRTLIKQMMAFTALLLTLCMAGCLVETSDVEPGLNGDQQDGDDILITIMIPGQETPSTRSIAGNGGEAKVKDIYILVFENGGPGLPEILAESANGEIISQSVEDNDDYKVQFKTYLASNTNAKTLAIIANMSPALINSLSSKIGESKHEILKMLEFTSTGKWNADPSTYTAIPMYGEALLGSSGVTHGMKIADVPLTRMLARIDVENKAGNFTLSAVYLLNYNQTGYIAPAWETGNGKLLDPQYQGNPMIPGANAAQTGIGKAMVYNYAGTGLIGEIYTFEALKASGKEGEASHANAICLIIKGKRNNIDQEDQFYRIDFTAGKDANNNAPLAPGFNPGTVDYMHVYRNHRYHFEISEVNGRGYEDIESAYKSLGIMNNLKTHLHVVDMSDITDIVFNGEHYLGVGDFEGFNWSGGDANVLVSTNYAYGWSVKKITYENGSNWLTAAKQGAGSDKSGYLLLTAGENNVNAERKATVYLTAGRLEYQLKVTQKGFDPINIRIFKYANGQKGEEISSLEFIASGIQQVEAQSFIVEWQPADATLNIATHTNSYQSAFVYNNSPDVVTPGTYTHSSGTRVYTIRPGSLASSNPLYEQGFTAIFSITANDETKKAELDVRHYNCDAVVEKNDFYLLDGSDYHSFTVKSNVEWKAYYIRQEVTAGANKQFIKSMGGLAVQMDNSASPILVGSGGHNLATGGTRIDFSVIDEINTVEGPQTNLGEGYIRIVSNDTPPKSFADKNETLLCGSLMPKGDANCYIMDKNEGIGIPAFAQMDRAIYDGLLNSYWYNTYMNFKAHVLWVDNPNLLSASSVGIYNSSGRTYLRVHTGEKYGNAVVALYNDSNYNGIYDDEDEIKWSWHIWVTDYDPDNQKNGTTHTYAGAAFTTGGLYQGRKIMDRNLGATWTATDGADIGATMLSAPSEEKWKRTFGLMYQWGRKDPFPGAEQIYNASGNPTSINTAQIPSGTSNNLPNAVKNPMTFITSNFVNLTIRDWYSSNGNPYDNLWCSKGVSAPTEGLKTAYDPCPAGWRVPIGGEIAANNPWAGFGDGNSNSTGWGYSTIFLWNGRGRYYIGNSTNAWYPASGSRDPATGNVIEVSERGYSWGSTRNKENTTYATSDNLYFAHDIVRPLGNSSRAFAFPVRCIKEKQ